MPYKDIRRKFGNSAAETAAIIAMLNGQDGGAGLAQQGLQAQSLYNTPSAQQQNATPAPGITISKDPMDFVQQIQAELNGGEDVENIENTSAPPVNEQAQGSDYYANTEQVPTGVVSQNITPLEGEQLNINNLKQGQQDYLEEPQNIPTGEEVNNYLDMGQQAKYGADNANQIDTQYINKDVLSKHIDRFDDPGKVIEQFDNYAGNVEQIESDGNEKAKNPKSSASGLYQMVDATFDSAKKGLLKRTNDKELRKALSSSKDSSQLSAEHQRALFTDWVANAKGSDDNFFNTDMSTQDQLFYYLAHHHTKPDEATFSRAYRQFYNGNMDKSLDANEEVQYRLIQKQYRDKYPNNWDYKKRTKKKGNY